MQDTTIPGEVKVIPVKNPRTLLQQCLDLIQHSEGCDKAKAFKILLQWLALQVHVDGAIFKSKIETEEFLRKNMDLESLKCRPGDWLGELYFELGLSPKNSHQLISYDEARAKAKALGPNRKDRFPEVVLDAEAGTGRTMMAAYNQRKGRILLYGVEKDKMLFRICLVNLAMYGVNAKVILHHNGIDIANLKTGDDVWEYANNWFGNKLN